MQSKSTVLTPRYIKHERRDQEWLMLDGDNGAAVTALSVAVAGDLPLEEQGEFRVASRAVFQIRARST